MIDNKKALSMAKAAYEGSTNYFDTNIRPQVERDMRQFQGRHTTDSKYSSDAYRARSKFYRPKTRAAIRKNEAVAAEAFFSTLDAIDVGAENDADENQKISSEIMQALLQYRLTKTIPWFLTCIGAYQDAQVNGVVISHQEWIYDQVKGIDKPAITLIPIENFRFDPASSWVDPIGTSPYLVHLIPMYVKDVKKRMASGEWMELSDNEIKSSIKNFDSTRLLREDSRSDSRDQVTEITDYTVVWVHRNIIEDEGIDLVYYTLGTEFLLTNPVELSDKYGHSQRPYVMGFSIIETHKPYPSGLPRITRDVQMEINELANQRMDNVKFVLNKRYFVRRNRQVDIRSLTRNVPGSVTLLTHPEEDVKVMDTPDVTGSSYQEQDRLNLDFDDLAGAFSQSSVQSNRRLNETVGGMNILTSNSNQLSAYQLRTFVETWVEPVLRQLVKLEYHYETDERILRLVGQKSKFFERFGDDAAIDNYLSDDISVTVNVGMGATNPTEKVNTLMLGLNSLRNALGDGVLQRNGLDAVEITKEVLGAIGYRDGGRFIVKTEDPQIASLQQQIDQLQQAMNAKYPPELLQAQVDKLKADAEFVLANKEKVVADKVKSGVEASYAAMQAAEVIASVPAVAPVADKVMEVAGYIRPTPAGIDPNFVSPGMDQAAGVAQATGADQIPMQLDGQGNTDPMSTPNMPTAGMGERAGIETQRLD